MRDPFHSADVAFATPLSLLRDSARRELHLQLALIYGESGALRGVACGLGVLRVRRDLLGVASGLGVVEIGGRARGVVVAVGGAFAGDLVGVVTGAGVASARSLQGAAVSAGATMLRGPSEGLLFAAGANLANEHRGLQLAGGFNRASRLEGVAVGAVNVQRRVVGLQIGVVNMAEQVDGAAIGLLSFAKNGRVQPVLWGGADGSAHLAIKSIAGYAFTELGGGVALNADHFVLEGGLGAHLQLGQFLFFEPGVHYSVSPDAATSGSVDEHQVHYLAQLGLRVGNKLDLLAAAGVRHTVARGSGQSVAPELRAGIALF